MTHTRDAVCPGCELKLKDAHPALAYWFRNRVKPKYPNAHISWSFRGMADQEHCVTEGKSQLAWPKSKHNHTEPIDPKKPFHPALFDENSRACALALDLFEISDEYPKGSWDPRFFAMINRDNFNANLPIKWGGAWKSIGDADHYEIDPKDYPDEAHYA